MSSDAIEAVASQPAERVVQPQREWITPEERLLLRFYRELDEREQAFMRLAIEAMALKRRR